MMNRKITMNEMQTPGKTLINRKKLLNIVPLSERTIFDMEKRGEFPRRFAITPRMVVWDLREIEDWIENKKAAAVIPPAPHLAKAS